MFKEAAVLWDMDGVLVDTKELYFECFVKIFEKRGLKFEREQFIANFGRTTEAAMTAILGNPRQELLDELVEDLERTFKERSPGSIRLCPGVEKWLRFFKDAGYSQAVASSAPMESIERILKETNLQGYFSALVSAIDLKSKPDPAVFLESAQRLGLSPQNCLVVEDSPVGVEAGRRAGMKTLAVQTTQTADKLSKADMVVENLDKLQLRDLQKLL